jgi:hypothetical protein
MLVGAAISSGRKRGCRLKDKFHRLKARHAAMRDFAIAIAPTMLAKGMAYRDLGEAYLDQIGRSRIPSQTSSVGASASVSRHA